MRKEVEQELNIDNNFRQNSNRVFSFLRIIKKEGKDLERGSFLTGKDGWLGFTEIERSKIWKENMEKIMNEENE